MPLINDLLPHYGLVIATQDWHPANHGSFASNHAVQEVGSTIQLHGLPQILWPDHCIQDTAGAEFAPTLEAGGIDEIVPKQSKNQVPYTPE